MDYKRFTIQVVIRVAIMLALSLLIAFFFFSPDKNQLVFTFFVLSLLLFLVVVEFIWFVNRTNRELSKFLMAIKYSDFSVYFPNEKKKGHLAYLYRSFNTIIDSFKKLNSEKHLQYEMLQLIIAQVKVGIICTNGKSELVLMNQSAENMLMVFKPKTWLQLSKKAASFTSKVDEMQKGGKNIIELKTSTSTKQLVIHVNHIELFGEPHRIITFHDIKEEIEQKESEAWIRLIRILNHEIMNSVTPISSLTETILMILGKDENEANCSKLDNEMISDVIRSVKTIQNRSEGLYDFVTEYRKLTKIPEPKIEQVLVVDLFRNAFQLWKSELEKHKIKGAFQLSEEDLSIQADPNLIEQVLINMIKNSIQALENISSPELNISGYIENDSIKIEIQDNGKGIPEDIINDIFVPFYTTKEQGSGIGLSLVRQIMRMHNGNVTVESAPDEGTTFILQFNQLN